jgi:hypothetical protein
LAMWLGAGRVPPTASSLTVTFGRV